MASPRRRDTTTDTLPEMLRLIDRYLLSIDGGNRETDAAPALDCHVVFTYISVEGQRIGVGRDQLAGQVDGWPLPGKYEADYVDSNGVTTLGEPWTAVEFDPEALKALAKGKAESGGDRAVGDLVEQLLGTARVENRNLRARAEAAEKREEAANEDRNRKIDTIGRLQKEKNDAVMRADKAVADKELAEAQRKDAEEALEHLEDQNAALRPQIHAAVDRIVERGIAAFGGAEMMLPPSPDGAASNGAEHRAPEQGADPPPPGADDPAGCMEDLLDAVVFDVEVARELVDKGILSWETICALMWLKRGINLGPVPNWGAAPAPAGAQAAEAASAAAGGD